ncbi:unnamed protein product [Spirodela intermedia]|uniref:BED-type domain-containing protein n=1 Tax=Spirodela intermedia TaxID=51605 RepID=A0A7I8L2Q6_SPIIN|nr:unnamed protein product [Spirodela intermedia]
MVGIFDGDYQPLAIEAPPSSKRRGRKKSEVWEHFTVESVASGSTRARCKRCDQTFAYSSGTKIAGTSHLKRHIAMGSCPRIREEKKHQHQQLALTPGSGGGGGSSEPPAKRRYRSSGGGGGGGQVGFDQEHCCEELAKMIAMEEYPLHMVEHPAFTAFVQGLQPRFRVPSFSAMESEIIAIYRREKQSLREIVGGISGRVSLTVGLWTTAQTLGYVCLTGHFIDGDWKLRRWMLSFTMVSSPHSENALSEVIGFSLSDWSLTTKLFTITLDNYCSSHDIYSANLRDHLSSKNTLVLKGQLFVVRCYAHILSVIAQDLLASIHGVVYSVRESLKYVKATPEREQRFAEVHRRLGGASAAAELRLDVQSRWDTTYLMLAGALELRHVFAFLESSDADYNDAPSPEDWKKVEAVCGYIKLLYDSAMAITAAPEPTANLYFHEVWKIQLELARAAAGGGAGDDGGAAKEMHEKFDKYWKDCSLVMAIAVVMDPRFKMKLVEFSFTKIYDDDAERYIKVVNDGIHDLFLDYVAQPLPLTPAYTDQHSHYAAGARNSPEAGSVDDGTAGAGANGGAAAALSSGDGLLDFDMYISATAVGHQGKSELDQYLEEALVPRVEGFEILEWWKLNELKYPTLAKMARDVLAIPMSIVPMGSVFGAGGGSRLLDDYRSSLRPETVEALFCARDWLQHMPTRTEPPPPPLPSTAIVKTEF